MDWKLCVLTEMPPPTSKKEIQSFLGIMNYLRKHSLLIAKICEPLHRITSVKSECIWNRTYQKLYEKAKALIKMHT